MGVSISEIVSSAPTGFSQLAGKRLAVDAYNTIYQFLSSIRQSDGTPLMDSKGSQTGHLSGVFYRNARVLENGIKPIYVFDGIPPEIKKSTLLARKEVKMQAEADFKRAKEEGRDEDAKKYAQRTSRLTKPMVEEAKKLLGLMGIPVVQAPSEGEAQASALAKEGVAYAVASQDFDSLLFGAPLLVRNLSVSGKRKLPGKNEVVDVEPEMISLEETLKLNGLSRQQLIWIGMLIGNDFNEGIKGIGPKKALKIVRECKSLDDIVKYARAELKYEFPEEVFGVERFFLDPPASHDVFVQFGMPDEEGLKKFLCDEHDFSLERVERAVKAIEKKLNDKTEQKGLNDWF